MELFNIKFVGEIEKHRELYDNTHKLYNRKDCVERAWNKVAKEVNLSAGECKEKWRNLRNTLAKNLKSRPSNSGATRKRPYYLMEAMQFALPFIKGARDASGNLPEIHQQGFALSIKPENFEVETKEETLFSDDMSESKSLQISTTSVQSRPSSETTRNNTILPNSIDMGEKGRPDGPGLTRKRKVKNNTAIDSDNTECLKTKTAKLSNTPSSNDRRESIQNFLNSLIPDLMQLNSVQLRIYKRRALLLIDEVTGTSPDISDYSTATTFIHNPNHFCQSSVTVQSPTESLVSLLTSPRPESTQSTNASEEPLSPI